MGPEYGEAQVRVPLIRPTNDDEFEQWCKRAWPVVHSAQLAAMAASLPFEGGRPSRTQSDQLDAASKHLRQWAADNPCPDPATAEYFTKLVSECSRVADTYELAITEPRRRVLAGFHL